MLRELFKNFGATIYTQIWENRIKLINVTTGIFFDEKPLVALKQDNNGKQTIVAIGNSSARVSGNNIKIINPFSHPRTLISDFVVGEKLIQYVLKEVLENKLIQPSPVMVVHPMEKTEGGLTMIEKRAFREFAISAGARDSVVYQGHELSIHNMNFEFIKEQVGEQ